MIRSKDNCLSIFPFNGPKKIQTLVLGKVPEGQIELGDNVEKNKPTILKKDEEIEFLMEFHIAGEKKMKRVN